MVTTSFDRELAIFRLHLKIRQIKPTDNFLNKTNEAIIFTNHNHGFAPRTFVYYLIF